MMRVAVLPGDGIGAEVMAGPLEILQYLSSLGHITVTGPWLIGASAHLAHGTGLPAETLAACEAADAILFGAVGDHPGFNAHDYRPETSLIFLREHFDLRISVRQVWRADGEPLTIIRNLLGGAYGAKEMRRESDGTQLASDLVQLTPEQVREVLHLACDYAAHSGLSLISVDKANLLATSRLWRRLAREVSAARGLVCQHVYVDRFAFDLTRSGLPDGVVVTEGLFGDILSDLAAAVAGSIALCSSASIHPGEPIRGRCRGLYEPVHGTAPDITGKDLANPAGTYLALASALEGFPETAEHAGVIRSALTEALRTGPLPRDLAPRGAVTAGTRQFSERVNQLIASALEAR
jgi:isocitrate/isopropylmalate dehydrogenase